MAVLGSTYADLIDLVKVGDPSMGAVIEMLKDRNPIMEDAITQSCNQGSTHKHRIRTGLPAGSWGRLYKGINQDKSNYAQVTDTTGFIEQMSHLDKRLYEVGTPKERVNALRMEEATGHLQAIANTMQEAFFYGNTDADPDQFHGLSPRFNDLSAKNGAQIIDAGGTGSDNTSIWFVGWGDSQTHLIHPAGTQAGIIREDKGEQRVTDSNANPYFALEEVFRQHCGLAVKNWQYVSRIANIDVSDVAAGTVDLYGMMRKAYYALENRRIPGGRFSIYMNTDMLEALDALATNAGSSDNFVRLRTTELEGKEVETYRKMPIRETDALLNTEARVV